MAVARGGEGLGAVGLSQPRPAAAANTRTQNSGKDHKLWPGRFPGTGEYGPRKVLRKLSKNVKGVFKIYLYLSPY